MLRSLHEARVVSRKCTADAALRAGRLIGLKRMSAGGAADDFRTVPASVGARREEGPASLALLRPRAPASTPRKARQPWRGGHEPDSNREQRNRETQNDRSEHCQRSEFGVKQKVICAKSSVCDDAPVLPQSQCDRERRRECDRDNSIGSNPKDRCLQADA